MTQNRMRAGSERGSPDEDRERPAPRYLIDLEEAASRGRSLPLLIASRRCYACQQADETEPSMSSDVKPYLDCVADHCAQTPDFLLPDTPLKEAIFRVILARRNEPVTAEDIRQVLSEKWRLTAYPRDISPRVIERLLTRIETYCVTAVPEEPEEEIAEEPVSEEPPTQNSVEEIQS